MSKQGNPREVIVESVTTDVGEIVQAFIDVAKSVQLPSSGGRAINPGYLTNRGYLPHPFDMKLAIQYKALDITYRRSIQDLKSTIAGMGYHFQNKEALTNEAFKKFIAKPNNNFGESLRDILEATQEDLETYHNSYWEIVKSNKNSDGSQKMSLYRLPSRNMYLKPKKNSDSSYSLGRVESYGQILDIGANTIKDFAPYTGKFESAGDKVIHIKYNSDISDYYGSPSNQALYDKIKQNYLADQYGIKFFANDATPSYFLLVTGGKLSKKSLEAVQENIESLKGVDNSHKMMTLTFPSDKTRVQVVQMSKELTDTFIKLIDNNRDYIAMHMGMFPKLLGISQGGNFGGGSAGIADLKLYIEKTVEPKQLFLQDKFNALIEEEFGFNPEMVLYTIDISSDKDDAVCASMYFNMMDEFGNRVLGVNEIRKTYLNLDPIELSNVPIVTPAKDTATTANEDGDARTTGTETETGDNGDAGNLDPDKNKK